MFVLCPHCQFLVTVDPASGAPPARCPRCRGLVATVPAGNTAAPDGLSAAMAELAPPPVVASERPQAMAARDEATDGSVAASADHPPSAPEPKTRLPWNAPGAQSIGAGPTTTATAEESTTPAGSIAVAAGAGRGAPAIDTFPASALLADDIPASGALPGLPAADAAPGIDRDVAADLPRDDKAAAQPQDVDVHAAAPGAAMLAAAEAAPDNATRPGSEEAPALATPAVAPSPTPARARHNRVPTWLRKPRLAFAAFTRFRRWRAPAAIAALTVLLAVQMLLADRAQLAADARWRPSMQAVCGVLGCDLPPWRQPEAFRLLERNVAADPKRLGVLKVRARFRNDARWPQPWPAIALTLSDADGRTVGARVFTPGEYLATGTTQNGIASGQLATASIDVVEPAPGVVAFTFEFR